MGTQQRRAVVFDFGGVLITTIANQIATIASDLDVESATLHHVLLGPRESTADHPWHRAERGEPPITEIQHSLAPWAQRAGIALLGDEIERLLAPGGYTIVDTMIERIAALRAEGMRTALLSNTFAEFRPVMERDIDFALFDAIIESFAVGAVHAVTSGATKSHQVINNERMTTTDNELDTGARSPGVSYQDLLDADTHPVPDVLRLQSARYFGSDDVPIERYTSREWHRREVDQMWSRVWQFACREEHIPEPGDYIVYEIAELSFLVMRQEDGSIKSYPNACLHRGRQLKEYDGHCSEIRCPFHGFAWKLDGRLQDVPAAWDFPHVDQRPDDFTLPECSVGTWAGFVFINPDPGAAPLEEHLGELMEHFEVWDLENRYVEAQVSRVIEANWKIAQEAFCEAYHVNATHPQILTYLGDVNSQVDVFDHCSRVITPGGTPSPLLGDDTGLSEQEMLRSMLDVRIDQDAPFDVPDGKTARQMAAAASRERWRPIVGDHVDQMSDSEMMDSLDYTVFPNFHPWGAFNRIVYRFRPNGDDHRSSIMEVFFLSPFEGERPPPATEIRLGVNDPWTDAPVLGMLAKVFQQDVFNMAKVQKGLETTRKPGATFSNYQESKIRWLHTLFGEWVNDDVAVSVGTGASARSTS